MGEWRGFGEVVKCFAGEKRRLRGSGKEASEIKGGGQSTASACFENASHMRRRVGYEKKVGGRESKAEER